MINNMPSPLPDYRLLFVAIGLKVEHPQEQWAPSRGALVSG
ncbi:hypothetical protein [Mycobacterium leprae]|nr:hypothetical protein [Mycobacterium leprae]